MHFRVTNWAGIISGFVSVAAVLASSTVPVLAPYRDYFLLAVAVGNIFVHPTKPAEVKA